MRIKTDITALGELLIDFTPAGVSQQGMRLFEQNPGGAPANLLAAAAKFGRKTAFIGKVGKDMHGDFLKETLIRAGINTDNLIQDEKYFTTLAFVSLKENGEREFAFARKPGADTNLCMKEIDPEILENTRVFHVGSLSLTDDPSRTATYEAINIARNSGAVISYDPNYRAALWSDPETAQLRMQSLIPYVDMMKISDEETSLLTPYQDPEEAIQYLLRQGVHLVAVTLGRELARIQPLYASGYISQQQFDQAQSSATSAQLAYESAKNQYDLQVEYTTVTAPISGVIESRNVEPHDHIGTDTKICVISGGDQLQVKFGVTEKILRNMKVNDPVQVEKNGTDYEGNVTEIGSMVNSATGLYDAKAFVNNAESLTSGTKVKLTVVMDQVKDVLTVPVDAVNYDNGKAFVYCYDNGAAKKVMIEAGIYDAQTMEVKSGLTAGDQVITTWSNELVDGQEVLIDSDNGQNENAAQGESAAENAGEETQKAGE